MGSATEIKPCETEVKCKKQGWTEGELSRSALSVEALANLTVHSDQNDRPSYQ